MAFNRGPKIVTNGLVLALDAASKNSYLGSGTTWTDLSGNNNNGTLVNGPTFNSNNGGSIFTDGNDDYITTPYSGSATDNYTFSAWFKNNDYSEEKYILSRGRDQSGNGWSLVITITTAGLAGAGVVPTVPTTLGIAAYGTSLLALNTWYYITGVWISSTSINVYVNGILEGTTLTTGRTSLRTSTNGFNMSTNSSTIITSGYTAAVHVYNRTLSATEIQQNYNATKSRFNL